MEVDLDEGLKTYRDISNRVLGRIYDDLGLNIPMEPPMTSDHKVFDGRLPPAWSSLDLRDMGELFEMMTAYADYVGGQLVMAKAAVTNAKERLALVKAKVRKSVAGSVEERNDTTEADARYVTANAEWLEAQEFFEILGGIAEAANRDIRMLSRQLETRKLEMEGAARSQNVRGTFVHKPRR
jgi:hypothetical protein